MFRWLNHSGKCSEPFNLFTWLHEGVCYYKFGLCIKRKVILLLVMSALYCLLFEELVSLPSSLYSS